MITHPHPHRRHDPQSRLGVGSSATTHAFLAPQALIEPAQE
jgi:hypothetical protein